MHATPNDESTRPDRPLLNIFLLGHMRVLSSTGLSLLPTGTKTRALLAILALSNRRPVARTRLAELLWSTRAPEQARASLRQEIHRLMDILSPLGPEVLDVQRHTLAIRPGLTDIDTEHVLRTTAQTVMDLPNPLPPLLEDLSAVDPGFALWLEEERNRLLDHKTAQLEALLASTPDAATTMAATQRLLRLNPLNEGAWRAHILAAIRNKEEGAALLGAETCLRTFENTLGTTPGQQTMRLIAQLRAMHRHTAQAARPSPAISPQVTPATTSQPAPEPAPLSATVFLSYASTQGPGVALAEQFRSELGLDMAMHGVMDISVQAERFAAPPLHTLSPRGRWDFLVSITVINSTEDEATCLLQAFDTRLDNTIVWGHRLHLSTSTLSGLANRFASVLLFSLFMAEARRVTHRPVAELSAFGLGLRALSMSLRRDAAQNTTIEHLLAEAEKRAPDNPFLFFVHTHYLLLRMYEEWSMPVAEFVQPLLGMLKRNFALFPDNVAVHYMLTAVLFYAGQPAEARFLLEQTHITLSTDSRASIQAMQDGLAALCRGDAVTAAHIYTDFFGIAPTAPFFTAPDQEFILSCFLAGRHEETLRLAREILATSADRSAILVPALAAANMLGHQSLAQDYRQRLHRLQTPLTCKAVEGHYGYLPPAMVQKLCRALHLPQP
ncbi:MAG: BTAD domain-containing putative transcriptional regulator [Acetobacter sp.]